MIGRMSRNLLKSSACVLVLLAAVVLGASPGAAAPDSLNRPQIVNGLDTWDYPAAGILLSGGSSLSASLTCSGTLIGCSTFITASHCVCETVGADCQSGDAGEPSGSDYMVFLQNSGFHQVSSIEVHPDYDFPTADVAIVHLAAPVTGITPMPINTTATPPTSSAATIVGFGRSGGSAYDYGLKRQGDVSTIDCGTPTLVCWDFANPIGTPGEDSNTCNGDSGGPLFWHDGSNDVLAGITSGGNAEDCLPLDESYDANVFHYRSWITTKTGADLGGEACGAFPPVGSAPTTVETFAGSLSSAAPQSHHSIEVPAGTSVLRVTMNGSEEGGADFDLYVRAGAQASSSNFDCKHAGANQVAACEFTNPAPGTWWLLVQRYAGDDAFQATATLFSDGCSGAGEGSSCDDQNPCTSGDVCTGGVCGGAAVVNGTACDDGENCSWGDSCQTGTCTGSETPRTDCLGPTVSGKASLLIKNNATDDSRDSFAWRWRTGEATDVADFGSPTTGGPSDICIYDSTTGTDALAAQMHVAGTSGWSQTSTGYLYRGDGLADGVKKIVEKAGVAGKASVQVSGKGGWLPDFGLPFTQDPRLTVQLVTDAACFESVFSTAVTNSAAEFKAISD